jgi:hypothetical protein
MVVTSERLDGVLDGNDIANIQARVDDYFDDVRVHCVNSDDTRS